MEVGERVDIPYHFLNDLLDHFKLVAVDGMVNLKPIALGLVTVLGIIDLTTMWGLYFGEMRVREMVGKAIKIGFFAALIMNWGPLTMAVEGTFTQVARVASGNTADSSPTGIMQQANRISYRLFNNAVHDVPLNGVSNESKASFYDDNGHLVDNYKDLLKEGKSSDDSFLNVFSGFGDSIAQIPGRFIKLVLCVAIYLAFAFIALNVILCYVEFYITTALSIILIPFGVNSHTSFMSQKALGALVNFGTKLMIMLFLIGIMSSFIQEIKTIQNDDYAELFEITLQACMYAFLIWQLPTLISGMLSGSPSMGASAGGVAAGASAMMNRTGNAIGSSTRGMINAAAITGDAIRASRADKGFWSHINGVTKDTAKNRIDRAKNAIFRRSSVTSNKARMLSNARAKAGGYQ